MRKRTVMAAIAILGIVALGIFASAAVACGGGQKTSAQASGMSGGCPHMSQMSGGGSCAFVGGAPCGGVCGAGMGACAMNPSDCEKMIQTYYKTHGWLGVELTCAKQGEMEPTVTKVFPGSPAEAAGLKVGDVLVSINGISFGPDSKEGLTKLQTEGMKVGDAVSYTIKRPSQNTDVQINASLIQAPEGALAQMVADHKSMYHKSDKAENSAVSKKS